MSSIDITPDILEYRNAVTSLWENIAKYKEDEFDWDLCDVFADMCDGFFSLIVLRPHGISGVTKAKQYDRFPAEIPAFAAIPAPGTGEIIAAELNEHGGCAWRAEKYREDTGQTFAFVDLYDFDTRAAADRKFEYILTKVTHPQGSSRKYALLPIKTTKVLWQKRRPRKAGQGQNA